MLTDEQIEREVIEKGLTHARVTLEQIDALVDSLIFKTYVIEGSTTTISVALLPNGYSVAIGQSSCVVPSNFDAELGAKIAIDEAREKARKELWRLEGYRLAVQLEDNT